MVDKFGKYMVTGVVLVMMFVIGWNSLPLQKGYELFDAMCFAGIRGENMQDGQTDVSEEPVSVSDVVAGYNTDIYKQHSWIDLNGAMARGLNIKGLYKDMGLYILGDNYIASSSAQTSTDYEYEQICSLRQFLDERGIHLLYVNAPTKYLDDSVFQRNFGIRSYANANADLFLQRITEAGIDNMDLREELSADGKNIYDMFYRTDHHWTVDNGFWAACKLTERLNKDFGYQIDEGLYDLDNFQVTRYPECWLGEQGRKVAETYVGLDDYVRIEPKYDTKFVLTGPNAEKQGTFTETFINEDSYAFDKDVYSAPLMHYSYISGGINQTKIINENQSEGKILLLGDSYSQCVVPFLALGVHEVDSLVLRGYADSLRDYIDAGDYDTVVILYAEFMIGAHDYESSANYKMFTFD